MNKEIIKRGRCTQEEMDILSAKQSNYINVLYPGDESESFWAIPLEKPNKNGIFKIIICNNLICLGLRGIGYVGLARKTNARAEFLRDETAFLLGDTLENKERVQ